MADITYNSCLIKFHMDYSFGANAGSFFENWDSTKGTYYTLYRLLDARIARFHQVEPLVDSMSFVSSYAFVGNFVTVSIDPLGDTIIINIKGEILSYDSGTLEVFVRKNNQLVRIGEVGGQIDAKEILDNFLKESVPKASNIDIYKFIDMVRTGGEWDLKNNEKYIWGFSRKLEGVLGLGNESTTFVYGKMQMKAQDVGNFHFGIVGAAFFESIGIASTFAKEHMLRIGAGLYQIKSGTSSWSYLFSVDIKYVEYKFDLSTFGNFSLKIPYPDITMYYGDDPRDQEWIIKGVKHYSQHFRDIVRVGFCKY